jgi:hypothetical protein
MVVEFFEDFEVVLVVFVYLLLLVPQCVVDHPELSLPFLYRLLHRSKLRLELANFQLHFPEPSDFVLHLHETILKICDADRHIAAFFLVPSAHVGLGRYTRLHYVSLSLLINV